MDELIRKTIADLYGLDPDVVVCNAIVPRARDNVVICFTVGIVISRTSKEKKLHHGVAVLSANGRYIEVIDETPPMEMRRTERTLAKAKARNHASRPHDGLRKD
jgi:hypothetical protein